jgi:hypothetical protein
MPGTWLELLLELWLAATDQQGLPSAGGCALEREDKAPTHCTIKTQASRCQSPSPAGGAALPKQAVALAYMGFGRL